MPAIGYVDLTTNEDSEYQPSLVKIENEVKNEG
jgi:hypothetical protein